MPKQVVTGTANGYLTAGGQVVSLSAKSGHSASSKATALPQTGNNSSLAAVVLGAVSMMFGFGLMKKWEM
ncbi:LPXTG cell wall anchor domain-containing protein [Limosilactobacillus agrestimuris]|uniref:LPXTG cell wall anchor domain-containing protein n=1 Tax=Limosilactobacillus agrestimuris TaxID=2941331 RepID=UPI0024083607|nr:LPXTG cell wall anchor domain-containing protein [Limosilactobacillus agrestimuris]